MKKGNLDVSKFPISVLIIKFFCDFRYLHDGLHYLLHYLDAHKLVRTVEVDTAGEDVRTRQTLEAQLGSVGTAADRLYTRWNAALLHRSEHDINECIRNTSIQYLFIVPVLLSCTSRALPLRHLRKLFSFCRVILYILICRHRGTRSEEHTSELQSP